MKWSEKKNPFKVGDKVKFIYSENKIGVGVISSVCGEVVSVGGLQRHWRFCKKLKPKEKKYKITKKQLANAWDKHASPGGGLNKAEVSSAFISFCKELGIEE